MQILNESMAPLRKINCFHWSFQLFEIIKICRAAEIQIIYIIRHVVFLAKPFSYKSNHFHFHIIQDKKC